MQEAKLSIKDTLHDRGNKLVVRMHQKRKANEFDEGDKIHERSEANAKRPPDKKPVQKKLKFFFPKESAILNSKEPTIIPDYNPEQNKTVKKRSTPFLPSGTMYLFTDDEISHHSCWLERERRRHWNLKANQVNNSKQYMKYGKEELLGIIDKEWTLKKAELLQIRTVELQVMQDSLETVYHDHHPPPPPKTISGNNEALSKLLFYIKNENTRLASITSKKLRDQTEERLHNYLRDLKRTSDALFKAQNSREASLKPFKAKLLEEGLSICNVLSVEEENEIALKMFLESQKN